MNIYFGPQVKIKSEVASSNRQSEKLREALDTLTRRVDACRNPNMDKEVREKIDRYYG